MKRKPQTRPSFSLNTIARAIFIASSAFALAACATSKNASLGRGTTGRFEQADKNHDGKLSRDEGSDFLVNEIFDSRDANHDGQMTQQEWAAGDPTRAADFRKRDANHDGVVTKDEALNYGRAHGIANKIMRSADKNHDGVLDKAEVQAYYADREGPPN